MEIQYPTVLLATILSYTTVYGFTLSFPGAGGPFDQEDAEDPLAPGRKLGFTEVFPTGDTSARAGASLELRCEAIGSPSPTIHWLYQGSRIMQHGRGANQVVNDEPYFEETPHNQEMNALQLGSTSSRLLIDCVTQADAGEYTCVADTPFKRITSATAVEVEGGSENGASACARGHLLSGSPAIISMWSNHRLELEGADVQLYCRAQGRPAPTVTWYDRMNNPITGDEAGYDLMENGDLLIHNVNWMSHMGLYKCRAENSKGSDEQTAFLYPTSL